MDGMMANWKRSTTDSLDYPLVSVNGENRGAGDQYIDRDLSNKAAALNSDG